MTERMETDAASRKISLLGIGKDYVIKGKPFTALKDIRLDISDHDFLSIVGPSGCGKSTLLRIVAGLEEASAGKVLVDGREVAGPGPDRGMVFQTYTLFPWLTVEQNIAFGLKLRRVPDAEAREAVQKYLKLIRLEPFAEHYPKELSGGMKQRVAIARALANKPKILLMDEPFGALDQQTKESMQEMLLDIWEAERTTVMFVTHDIEEAVFIASRVCVMKSAPGRVHKLIDIPWKGERDRSVRDTPEFVGLRKEITNMLRR